MHKKIIRISGVGIRAVSTFPKAIKLSQVRGVSTEEIMGWFFQGFGFGFYEIDLAYSLADEANMQISQVF